MNIYDIANRAGTSATTVSRVLNNQKGVSEATRQRVLQVIEKERYTPNIYARGLVSSDTKTIGITCVDPRFYYTSHAISIIERELYSKGYTSLLCCTGDDIEKKSRVMEILLARRVSAIIIIGSYFVEASEKENRIIKPIANKIPVIFINGYIKYNNVYCILMNDYEIVKDTTVKAIKSGRKNPFFLYNRLSYSGKQKMNGFIDALKEMGIEKEVDEVAQHCPADITEAEKTIRDILKSGKKFDVLLTAEDNIAAAFLKCAGSFNISVPRDVDVVGYNNSMIAQVCTPELTSIDNRLEAMCMVAVKTLFGILDGADFPNDIILSGTLVKRKSTRF